MNQPGNKPDGRKVSLEDLLQAKRSERPSAEFWVHFEQELRAKQLAAIVHKRTWWQSLPRLSRRALWLQLPAGAAAAVVLSLMVIRENRPTGIAEREAKDAFIPAATVTTESPAIVAAVAPAPALPAPVATQAPEVTTTSSGVDTASNPIASLDQPDNAREQALVYSARKLIAMNSERLRNTELGGFAGLGSQFTQVPSSFEEEEIEAASPASKLVARAGWAPSGSPSGPTDDYRKTPNLNQRVVFSSIRLEVLSGGIQVGL